MNPIERLEAVAADILGDAHHTSLDDCIAEGCNYRGMCSDVRERHTELRAIIAELKQRDEAVRQVLEILERNEECDAIAARLRAALEGKHE